MDTPANVMQDLPYASQALAPADISNNRRFYWSIRRELWEHRAIWVAPVAAACIFLIAYSFNLVRLSGRGQMGAGTASSQPGPAVNLVHYNVAALLIMGTTLVIALFYCLEALHGERRDRSILFWKSLPVSDLTAVLSKAAIPLIVVPVLTFVITVGLQWTMLLLDSVAAILSGRSPAALWTHLPLFQMWMMLLYHLIAIHSLWYAPFFGWLLLISAWARRAPFLWAVLPPLVIVVVEKIAFNTSHFANLLGNRLGGGPESDKYTITSMSVHPAMHLAPVQFLISPGLWSGLVLTAIFLALAVRLRRSRGPI